MDRRPRSTDGTPGEITAAKVAGRCARRARPGEKDASAGESRGADTGIPAMDGFSRAIDVTTADVRGLSRDVREPSGDPTGANGAKPGESGARPGAFLANDVLRPGSDGSSCHMRLAAGLIHAAAGDPDGRVRATD
jgi:hypothetical protein